MARRSTRTSRSTCGTPRGTSTRASTPVRRRPRPPPPAPAHRPPAEAQPTLLRRPQAPQDPEGGGLHEGLVPAGQEGRGQGDQVPQGRLHQLRRHDAQGQGLRRAAARKGRQVHGQGLQGRRARAGAPPGLRREAGPVERLRPGDARRDHQALQHHRERARVRPQGQGNTRPPAQRSVSSGCVFTPPPCFRWRRTTPRAR